MTPILLSARRPRRHPIRRIMRALRSAWWMVPACVFYAGAIYGVVFERMWFQPLILAGIATCLWSAAREFERLGES